MKERIIVDSNGRKHITNEPQLHPPQHTWVGLTDINELVETELTHYWNGEYDDTTGARDQLSNFARTIEAKLKEKNT